MEKVSEKLLELKIPIDSFIDCSSYIEVIYDDKNVGSVTCYPTPGNRIIDTKSPDILNKFRWNEIYFSDREILDGLIADYFKIEKANLQITPGSYRTLYVYDNERKLVGSVNCSYEKGQWLIEDIN